MTTRLTTKQLRKDYASWQKCGFGYKSFVSGAAYYYKVSRKEIKNRLHC